MDSEVGRAAARGSAHGRMVLQSDKGRRCCSLLVKVKNMQEMMVVIIKRNFYPRLRRYRDRGWFPHSSKISSNMWLSLGFRQDV